MRAWLPGPLLLAACTSVAGIDGLGFGASSAGGGDVGGNVGTTVSATGGATAGSGGGGGGGASLTPWLAGWSQRLRIDVSPGRVGEDLAGFPLALRVVNAVVVSAQPDGRDLVFTDADGVTVLPFEIETFDATAGSLDAWVRVPNLTAADTTSVYLYVGNAGAAPAANPVALWLDHAAVWHLSDDLATASTVANSAGPEDHAFIPSVSSQPQSVDAVIGRGLDYDGTGDSLLIGNTSDRLAFDEATSFTYQLWVDTSSSDYGLVFINGGGAGDQPGYNFRVGDNDWIAAASNGTTRTSIVLGSNADLADKPTQLVAVVDRTSDKLRGYVNGALVAETDFSGAVVPETFAYLGHPTVLYKGIVDEIRVSPRALSSAWILAEFDNQRAPLLFAQTSIPEQAP